MNEGGAEMFKTICVGFDGSVPSENALRMACDLASKYGSAIHVVHTPKAETVAFALGAVAGYHVATTMPSAEETHKAGEVVLENAKSTAADAGQTDITCHNVGGDPAEAVVEKANETGADLIVTGRRGLGNISALVLGSTSQSIGHFADCAHMTVK